MATPTAPAPVLQPPATREFRAAHGPSTTWGPHDFEDYLDLPEGHPAR